MSRQSPGLAAAPRWGQFADTWDVIHFVRHGVPPQWLLLDFKNWLRYQQQVDVASLYPHTPMSMIFDMYREAYLPEALAWWWLYAYGSDIENARTVAAGIMARQGKAHT